MIPRRTGPVGVTPAPVLLALSIVLAAITLTGGRVNVLHGVLHLCLALVFVFLTIEP